MADDLKQTLEDAYLAYKRRHGLRDTTTWLRLKLVQAFEEQMRLDGDNRDHDNWKRIGDVARAEVAAIQPPARKAAE